MRRERQSSDSEWSAAEEGEATPLIGNDEDGTVAGKWYTGPLFVTGVKLAVLFMVFTTVVVGTFYWGIPTLDPEDRAVLKLPRSFEDLQNLKYVCDCALVLGADEQLFVPKVQGIISQKDPRLWSSRIPIVCLSLTCGAAANIPASRPSPCLGQCTSRSSSVLHTA
jgi:hypothetical protein